MRRLGLSLLSALCLVTPAMGQSFSTGSPVPLGTLLPGQSVVFASPSGAGIPVQIPAHCVIATPCPYGNCVMMTPCPPGVAPPTPTPPIAAVPNPPPPVAAQLPTVIQIPSCPSCPACPEWPAPAPRAAPKPK
jgi:hypothetical protein